MGTSVPSLDVVNAVKREESRVAGPHRASHTHTHRSTYSMVCILLWLTRNEYFGTLFIVNQAEESILFYLII